MRELKLSYGSWFLNILFLANVLLLSFVQPLYSQEVELKKAADLGEQGEKLFDQGRFTEALPIIEKAVSIYEKVLGPEHPDVATNLGNLALIYYRLGNFSKAE